MKRNTFIVLLICIMIFTITGFPAAASTLGAPEHFGACRYVVGDYFTFSAAAPDDLRELMDSSSGKAKFSGYSRVQIDYKLDNGDWHYSSDWDSGTTPNYVTLQFKENTNYMAGSRAGLPTLFPNNKADFELFKSDKNYFKSHTISFRARFALQIDGSKDYTFSDWSNIFVYSMDVKSDSDKLMSYAPTLQSAEVKKNSGGEPFIFVTTGRLPGSIQDMNAMTAGSVWTEIWLKNENDKEFKKVNDSFFVNEYIQFNSRDYFDKSLSDYSQTAYSVKIRYRVDLRSYLQSGRSDTIYSPFSNIVSHNMPAWSDASSWATTELKKASDAGLIPKILEGADMTKPITREEFCELSLLLYEKTTGKSPLQYTPNPFVDTVNQQILKAFALGITKGTSATTFEPNKTITRQECATMLYRTIKTIAPNSDYSITSVLDFPDQKDIDSWAVEGTKYMSKLGIIKGDTKGNFMPKATTTAQQAAGYGTATREAAVLMSIRTYDISK